MKSIAVLLTVHNRKAKTLQCLTSLYAQQPKAGYGWDVYLTNDGCTDGTPQAVKEQFPEVNIIEGDGHLFWNRGMYKAWQKAANSREYDYYLWLNDDTLLFNNAVSSMMLAAENAKVDAIICGATSSKVDGNVTYSGWKLANKMLLNPNGKLQECEIVNGNFLLVPKKLYNTIGNLDWKFRHAIGDFDYGLRAQKAGYSCYISPGFIGTCEANPSLPKWCLKSTPLLKRFKLLYSPLGYAEPIPFFIYEKRHFGLTIALKHFCSINLRALMPQLWK